MAAASSSSAPEDLRLAAGSCAAGVSGLLLEWASLSFITLQLKCLHCDYPKGASIYDVRTEGGEGVSPKEDVVREVA